MFFLQYTASAKSTKDAATDDDSCVDAAGKDVCDALKDSVKEDECGEADKAMCCETCKALGTLMI